MAKVRKTQHKQYRNNTEVQKTVKGNLVVIYLFLQALLLCRITQYL
jgi:hypothetical protein